MRCTQLRLRRALIYRHGMQATNAEDTCNMQGCRSDTCCRYETPQTEIIVADDQCTDCVRSHSRMPPDNFFPAADLQFCATVDVSSADATRLPMMAGAPTVWQCPVLVCGFCRAAHRGSFLASAMASSHLPVSCLLPCPVSGMASSPARSAMRSAGFHPSCLMPRTFTFAFRNILQADNSLCFSQPCRSAAPSSQPGSQLYTGRQVKESRCSITISAQT